jgi:hypothetical protein
MPHLREHNEYWSVQSTTILFRVRFREPHLSVDCYAVNTFEDVTHGGIHGSKMTVLILIGLGMWREQKRGVSFSAISGIEISVLQPTRDIDEGLQLGEYLFFG